MKVVVEQGDLLDALLAIMDAKVSDDNIVVARNALRKLIKESLPLGVVSAELGGMVASVRPANTSPPAVADAAPLSEQAAATQALAALNEKPISPLEARFNQLKEQHGGMVFAIQPTIPVTAGQQIPWHHGQEKHSVEILEPAGHLEGPTGKFLEGHWLAKVIDP